MTTLQKSEFNVDPSNPGQYFACCALLELASRLWNHVEARFDQDDRTFEIMMPGTRDELIDSVATCELTAIDPGNNTSTPIRIGAPFRQLEVDWWVNDQTGARDFKVWAGKMESFGIAEAMQHAIRMSQFRTADFFNVGVVVTNPGNASKKREPFYFDSRRAPNAHARDVGFATNDLGLTSIAHPAVELLCLIGLQVARPQLTGVSRVYRYSTWHDLMPSNLLLALSSGCAEQQGGKTYEFENWFRTGQRKHKSFRAAVLVSKGE